MATFNVPVYLLSNNSYLVNQVKITNATGGFTFPVVNGTYWVSTYNPSNESQNYTSTSGIKVAYG